MADGNIADTGGLNKIGRMKSDILIVKLNVSNLPHGIADVRKIIPTVPSTVGKSITLIVKLNFRIPLMRLRCVPQAFMTLPYCRFITDKPNNPMNDGNADPRPHHEKGCD
ncbi:hypothetical protein FKW77_002098 [Venturia effusa]|uniref:Uncharacterized protein n=1 Tax=Venturia effusa TaxID=50376 RepID=A0A517LRH1_9PEZI|nr:hypothetical protein FKW77_002098 [Venturia effusa]